MKKLLIYIAVGCLIYYLGGLIDKSFFVGWFSAVAYFAVTRVIDIVIFGDKENEQ